MSTKEILIVDPQPGAGDLLASKFKKAGCGTTVLPSITAALQTLGRPPKEFGAVLVHLHRDTKGLSDFPKVVKGLAKPPRLIGYAQKGDGTVVEVALKAGYQETFHKPVEVQDLIQLVKKWFP